MLSTISAPRKDSAMRSMRSKSRMPNIVFAIVLSLVAITAGNQTYAQLGDWETKALMSTARWNAAAGVINGKLYAAGGWNGTTTFVTLEVYDPATNSWETKVSMSAAPETQAAG
jgi:hypothetical protein